MTPQTKRLSAQCQRILEKLQAGPVSNQELSRVALKYTSRISDLRAAGYKVECVYQDRVTGLTEYALGR